ncbi:MAG: efflux RND transporter periplasmic adaptor subunit [Wenzhouxiangella sp.]
MGMKKNRKIMMLLLALGLLVLIGLGLRPAPVPVNVVETRLASFTEWVSEEGRTRLRETYTVSAPIAGYLQRVRPEPGDAVALGEALFLMEPLPAPALDARSLEQARENLSAARARQQTARANLETIDADARFAAAEYQRYRELHERGLVSTTEMERARNQRDRQQAARRAAEHAVEVAGFELESARAVLEIASGQRPEGDQPELALRSPIEGLVLRRHRCCEGAIAAGEAVLDVGSLDDLEVQVDLLSAAAVRIRPGMAVRLTGWGGQASLTGSVRRVEPAGFTRVSALGVDEQRVPVIVDIEGDPADWQGLGIGFRVEAEFEIWQTDQAVQLPASALFRHGDGWAVYTVEQGRARLQPVERGRSSGLGVHITEGLDAGIQVVNHPGDRLADGVRLRIDSESPWPPEG